MTGGMSQLISYGGICRTAPATPGLLSNISLSLHRVLYQKKLLNF